jgi:hypothetical protein
MAFYFGVTMLLWYNYGRMPKVCLYFRAVSAAPHMRNESLRFVGQIGPIMPLYLARHTPQFLGSNLEDRQAVQGNIYLAFIWS